MVFLPLVLRAAALGAAAGARSALGVAAPVAARSTGSRALVPLPFVGAELVLDKLPQTPSRLRAPGPQLRAASGAVGALLLARAHGATRTHTALAVAAGAAGGLAGAYGGAAWRARSALTRPDLQGGLVEDAAALLLAAVAVRG